MTLNKALGILFDLLFYRLGPSVWGRKKTQCFKKIESGKL